MDPMPAWSRKGLDGGLEPPGVWRWGLGYPRHVLMWEHHVGQQSVNGGMWAWPLVDVRGALGAGAPWVHDGLGPFTL